MKKTWVNKFEVFGIEPGKIFLPGLGELDLSNENLPIEKVEEAYRRGCPYLKLKTEESTKDSPMSADPKAEKPKVKKPKDQKNPEEDSK